MKVGDLVMLSKYGLARHYNRRLTDAAPYQTGLSIKVNERYSFPYKVLWMNRDQGVFSPGHCRRELKHAKSKGKT